MKFDEADQSRLLKGITDRYAEYARGWWQGFFIGVCLATVILSVVFSFMLAHK